MKFCRMILKRILQAALITVLLLTLSGCALLKSWLGIWDQTDDKIEVVENQSSAQQVDPTTSADDSTETVAVEPKLTPEQLHAAALQAKPNLYFSGSPLPPETATIAFQQALEAKQQNEFARAETLFTQLTQDFPDLSGPYVQLGDLVLRRHEVKTNPAEDEFQAALISAANYYQQAISTNQHNYFAHNRLAKVHRQQGQFELAENHYKQAIDSWPAFDTAYLNLGILYDLYLGQKVLALRQYEIYQALQDRPGRQVNGWIADLKRQIARANQL